MAIKSFPASSIDLIKDMEEAFPNTCIRPDETFEEHLRRAGAQDLIKHLKEWQEAAERATQ